METQIRTCAQCGWEWKKRNEAAEPKRCPNPECRSMLWSKEAAEVVRKMMARRAETEDDIEFRCSAEYGAAFIGAVKAANAGWGKWTWAQREKILAAEKERGLAVEI